MTVDLIVRNARLPGQPDLTDLGVQDGVFVWIGPHAPESAAREISFEHWRKWRSARVCADSRVPLPITTPVVRPL